MTDPESPNDDTTPQRVSDDARHAAYWRANLRLMGALLFVWFLVSYGFGILLVEQLNAIRWFGFRLGFWFAQQGSIYVFVVLIFVYVWRMNRLDQRYGVDEDEQVDEEEDEEENEIEEKKEEEGGGA